MESAGRTKLNRFLFVHLPLPCVAAAASIYPSVEESLRQQQRQIQLEQQRLQRAQRELERRRDAPRTTSQMSDRTLNGSFRFRLG